MENNLITALLSKANSQDKNKSAVRSEMFERHYDGADEFGKQQIDKILLNICGHSMIGLGIIVDDEKADVVIECMLDQQFGNFDINKGIEMITTPECKYGLMRDPAHLFWSYFITDVPLKVACIDYHEKTEGYLYIHDVETLKLIVDFASMGILSEIPVKH